MSSADRWLWMGSLYNPGFRVKSADGESSWTSHVSWANPVIGNFLGAQAIVLSRAALEAALVDWDTFEGNLDIRLAESAVRRQAGVGIHSPSLVQHAAVPSLWNGPAHRAVDFDPFFRAAPVDPRFAEQHQALHGSPEGGDTACAALSGLKIRMLRLATWGGTRFARLPQAECCGPFRAKKDV